MECIDLLKNIGVFFVVVVRIVQTVVTAADEEVALADLVLDVLLIQGLRLTVDAVRTHIHHLLC